MPLVTHSTVDIVIGCAIDVHRALGPGLLESAYERCLAHKFTRAGLAFARQVPLPIDFEGIRIECGYRVDFIVEHMVLVEIKSIERLLPVHSAQALTYLKVSGLAHGLLINFNVPVLTAGLKSFLNRDLLERSNQ